MTWRDDKTFLILAFFTVFFSIVSLVVVWFRPSDGQTYQTFVTQLAGFSGALIMHLRGEKPVSPPPGSTTVVRTEQEQVTKTPPLTQEITKESV